jgi:MFS family permease
MLEALRTLPRDGRLLFCTRALRLCAYGLLSVVLVLYLSEVGITAQRIGLLLSATLVGDIVVSLFITTRADRLGRRRMLVLGALLMLAAGAVFATTRSYWLLVVVAAVGIISPSGNEIGPFLSIEQAALSEIVPGERRTAVFAWYHLLGSFATAVGSLGGGLAAQALHRSGHGWADSYRAVVWIYAAIGLVLTALFLFVSRATEASHTAPGSGRRAACFGLHRSRGIVLRLSALFSLDAFAGGFVVQSIVAYWFLVRFGVQPAVLGSILFGANVLAGVSALAAAPLAARFGLINTMVFTHIPSNILLMLVPLMPNLQLAVLVLLLRFSISQMDVPTRQSYTMAVVEPDERSAASGVTSVARSVGASVSPSLAGAMLGAPALLGAPFLLSGGLKIVYDLLLYRSFRMHSAPGEDASRESSP